MSSFSLSLHPLHFLPHLHLLSHSILPGLSASRTHMLAFACVWCITICNASCSAQNDPYKSVPAYSHPEFSWNRMFRACSFISPHTSPSPSVPSHYSHTASSDRQGGLWINKQGNGCQLHGQGRTERGGALCLQIFIGYEKKEEAWGEHGRVYGAQAQKKVFEAI